MNRTAAWFKRMGWVPGDVLRAQNGTGSECFFTIGEGTKWNGEPRGTMWTKGGWYSDHAPPPMEMDHWKRIKKSPTTATVGPVNPERTPCCWA